LLLLTAGLLPGVAAILFLEAFSYLSLNKQSTERNLVAWWLGRWEMSELHAGGCHCARVRYQFSGPLVDIAHCHCSICRRVSGGLVTSWITLPRSAFAWVAGAPAQYESSASCVRYFCSHCGAQLALVTLLSPESIDVTVATLDHPELAPADRHIWVTSRLPWLHLDEHLPQEDGEAL